MSTFEIIEGVGYVIYNPVTKEYRYYNSESEVLLTTVYELEVVVNSNSNDTVIFSGISGDKSIYHTVYVED